LMRRALDSARPEFIHRRAGKLPWCRKKAVQ